MNTEGTTTGISNSKLLLYLGIASICMMFAGWTSGYIIMKAATNWLEFPMPDAFYISTAIIIISSITFYTAVQAGKKENRSLLTTMLLVTLALGIVFMYFQYQGWAYLTGISIRVTGGLTSPNQSASFFYVLTGFHALHLIGGILYLLGVCIRALFSSNFEKIKKKTELCSIYWHFLGLLWVFLLLFLKFI